MLGVLRPKRNLTGCVNQIEQLKGRNKKKKIDKIRIELLLQRFSFQFYITIHSHAS